MSNGNSDSKATVTMIASIVTATSIILFSVTALIISISTSGDISSINDRLGVLVSSFSRFSGAYQLDRHVIMHRVSISKLESLKLCSPIAKAGSPVGTTPKGLQLLKNTLGDEIETIEKKYGTVLPVLAAVDSVILYYGIEEFLLLADEVKLNAADLRALIFVCIREKRL